MRFSIRWTRARTRVPSRSLYSEKMPWRSASRTRCRITCLAVWAAIRPSSLHLEVDLDRVLDLGARAEAPRLVEAHLELGVRHLLDDPLLGEHPDRAGLPVERQTGIVPDSHRPLRGGQKGGLERLEEDLRRDPLLAPHLLDRQLELPVHQSLLDSGGAFRLQLQARLRDQASRNAPGTVRRSARVRSRGRPDRAGPRGLGVRPRAPASRRARAGRWPIGAPGPCAARGRVPATRLPGRSCSGRGSRRRSGLRPRATAAGSRSIVTPPGLST